MEQPTDAEELKILKYQVGGLKKLIKQLETQLNEFSIATERKILSMENNHQREIQNLEYQIESIN